MSQDRSPLGGQRHGRMGKSGYKQSSQNMATRLVGAAERAGE